MTTPAAAQSSVLQGVLWALAAGLCWGGAFIAPLVLTGYSSIEIVAGRFAGSGLFSLLMLAVAFARGETSGIGNVRVWVTACLLGLLGHLLYFLFLTEGVLRANAAIVTLIVGTLPIVIPVFTQLANGTFAWSKTLLPSLLIGAGLLAVHSATHGFGWAERMDARYWSGLAFGVAALVAWAWYAIWNARALAARPGMPAALWSSIQGVAQLPLTLPVIAISIMAGATHGGNTGRASFETFLIVSAALGIATSWMAMWCWNRASQLLPPDLAGQLIVFETVASLVYVYLWLQVWPPPLVIVGAALLLAGVLLGITRLRRT